ncbi:hypothetical protein ACFLEY_07220 [Bradyrhizobium sp. YCK136]|uniref:nSTAND1 domain-containing NTPase n=1 Tax=Bradyrhizobium sp. YCK136 TaxID=3351346 RepID=UPI0037CAAEFD
MRAYTGVGRVDCALARKAERVFEIVLGGEVNEPKVAAALIRLARLEGTAGPARRVARRREFTDRRWAFLQTLADVRGNRLVLIQTRPGTNLVGSDAGEETAEIARSTADALTR